MKAIKEEKNIEWFIDTILLGEVRSMVYDAQFHYLAFGIIASGIELLGACLDAEDFVQQNLSRKRFENAIHTLFDKEYHKFASSTSKYDLYGYFRCGMAHIIRPTKNISLTTRKESIKEGTFHLQEHDKLNSLVLVCEDFYDDLNSACIKLKKKMSNGETHKGLSNCYITVTPLGSQ